jgi:hypothetical protein
VSIFKPKSYEIGDDKMFVVYFLENKNVLLSQLLSSVPNVGDDLRIKGRKGKVTSVSKIDEQSVHVQVTLESITKAKLVLDNSKKKKK